MYPTPSAAELKIIKSVYPAIYSQAASAGKLIPLSEVPVGSVALFKSNFGDDAMYYDTGIVVKHNKNTIRVAQDLGRTDWAISIMNSSVKVVVLSTNSDLADVPVKTQAAAKPNATKPKAVKEIVLDTTKPLSTQVQVIAKQCGLSFSSVYNEMTKTKGRKIKLHQVRANKLHGAKLTQAKYKQFVAALLKVMSDNNVLVNSVEHVPAASHSRWDYGNIVVFFA